MEAYKKWVRKNKDYVHSMESLANGLPWLLPERFSASEIGPEAVTTFLGIITAINEHIIDTSPTQLHKGSAEPSSFPWSLFISMLKDLESLVEVVAQHFYGDDKKWNFIAITEATKVFFRLALFRHSGYKMLLHGGETPNAEKGPNTSKSQREMESFPKPRRNHKMGYLGDYYGHNIHNLEGRALFALSRFGDNARIASDSKWLKLQHQHALNEESSSMVEKPTLSSILSETGIHGSLFLMGELMFITRPLLYVLFIRKYGARSWIPWILSLVMDLSGMSILSYVTKSQYGKRDQHCLLSTSEKNEVKRRKLLLALYIMRDPFFSNYTRRRLENTEKLFEPVPVVGFLTAKFVELITGAQMRYTYMSGS